MTPETLIAELKAGIDVLQELHILAQTQSLFLEAGDLTGLTNVVEAKEHLVRRLQEMRSTFSSSLCEADLHMNETVEVKSLRERATYLLQHIAEVEARNQSRLEELKADAVAQSQKLQEARKLAKTYITAD